jgi:hypothetical protein
MARDTYNYQILIAEAQEDFNLADYAYQKATTGRRADGTFLPKKGRDKFIAARKADLERAEKLLLNIIKDEEDHKASLYLKAERERIKQEEAAKRQAQKEADRLNRKREREAEVLQRKREREEAKRKQLEELQQSQPISETYEQPTDGPTDKSEILKSIKARRKELGVDTTLEEQVLGKDQSPGIRDIAQNFISQNRELFDPNKMSGLAAQELLEQAVNLSEDALEARTAKESSFYLVRLKSILNIAKKTKGGDAVAAQIQSLIDPIVETLKKQSSVGARIRESAQDYARSIPERLLANIPVVGGILSEMARERREATDTEGEFLGRASKRISRRGSKSRAGYLDFDGGGFSSATRAMRRSPQAELNAPMLRASAPSADAGELSAPEYGAQAESPTAALNTIAQAIGEKGTNDPDTVLGTLIAIGKKIGVISGSGGGGMMDTITDVASAATGGGLGSIGRLGRGLKSIGSRALGAAGRLGGGLGSIGRLGRGLKSIGSRALGAAGRLGGGLMTRLGMRGAAGGAGAVGGGIFSSIGKGLSSAWSSVSNTAARLNPLKLLGDSVRSAAPKLGKALLTAPGIGAMLETAIGAMDIYSTKNDPNLTPDQKKEMIGKQLVGTIGGALGSVGGGVLAGTLGSVIPGAGTAIGGILGSMGGAWVGKWLGEQLGEALGGRGIYDLVESIPGLGSLISVDGEAQPQQVGPDGTPVAPQAQGTAGSIAPTASTGTEVGRQAMATAAARNDLSAATTPTTPGASVVATNNSRTNVNNVTNNFNPNDRIRNNEPTIQAFQHSSLVP